MRFHFTNLAVLVFILPLIAGDAFAGGRPLSAILTGDAEVPGPGDEVGGGVMDLTLNSGQEEICWELTVSGIMTPNRAHIHRGEAGTNGGVEVFFFDTVIPTPIPVPGNLSGCVDVPRALIKEIRLAPGAFYINVHNEQFPAGAIRGQLMK